MNALDHRLIATGALARLKAAGVEIHARSVFLQGLLLIEPDNLPDFFLPVRDMIASLHWRWAERGLSPLAGCLGFVVAQRAVDVAVVGVNSRNELAQIEAAMAQIANSSPDFGGPDLRIDPLISTRVGGRPPLIELNVDAPSYFWIDRNVGAGARFGGSRARL